MFVQFEENYLYLERSMRYVPFSNAMSSFPKSFIHSQVLLLAFLSVDKSFVWLIAVFSLFGVLLENSLSPGNGWGQSSGDALSKFSKLNKSMLSFQKLQFQGFSLSLNKFK